MGMLDASGLPASKGRDARVPSPQDGRLLPPLDLCASSTFLKASVKAPRAPLGRVTRHRLIKTGVFGLQNRRFQVRVLGAPLSYSTAYPEKGLHSTTPRQRLFDSGYRETERFLRSPTEYRNARGVEANVVPARPRSR